MYARRLADRPHAGVSPATAGASLIEIGMYTERDNGQPVTFNACFLPLIPPDPEARSASRCGLSA